MTAVANLRSDLEERERQAEVELSRYRPDRMMIRSAPLADLCRQSRKARIQEGRSDPYTLLGDIYRIEPELNSRKWSGGRPAWLDAAIAESRWAREAGWDTDLGGVAWLVEDRLVIRARYTLTLNDRLTMLSSDSTVYSMEMAAWVLVGVALGEELEDILTLYGIEASPRLRARIEGREHWREHLQEHVDRAAATGYRIPDLFPTDRTLKEHQQQGTLALAGMGSALLADQVGLGKGGSFTSGFLSRLQHGLEERVGATEEMRDAITTAIAGDLFPLVVVTNKSMREEIAEEIWRWKHDAVIDTITGTKPASIDDDVEFIVLNVDLLHHRMEDILEAEPRGMVVDEAHTLKNEDAKRTKAAQRLADTLRDWWGEDAYVVLATGTPFLNRPIELWSLLKILGRERIFSDYAVGKVGTQVRIRTSRGWRWRDASPKRAYEIRWCNGHYDRYGNWWNTEASHTAELHRLLLEHVMVRRRKSDVMHPLPELRERILSLDLDPEYVDEYRRIEDEFVEWMKEEAVREAEEFELPIDVAVRRVYRKLENAGAAIRRTKLRQAVARAKVAGIKEWIDRFMEGDPEITDGDPDRRKLIVFVYHQEIQAMLRNDPELAAYGMVTILHDQSGEEIQQAKREFQRDPRCRLILCYSGAREGHTLTAARDVLLAELPDVPTWVVQMAGRCWARMSEEYDPHEATVWYAVAPGTIDALSLMRIRIKKAMFDAVIDGEGEELSDDSDQDTQADMLLELMTRGHKNIKIAG